MKYHVCDALRDDSDETKILQEVPHIINRSVENSWFMGNFILNIELIF